MAWKGFKLIDFCSLLCSHLDIDVLRILSSSQMDPFAKLVNSYPPWTIFATRFILDVWKGSEYNPDKLTIFQLVLLCRFVCGIYFKAIRAIRSSLMIKFLEMVTFNEKLDKGMIIPKKETWISRTLYNDWSNYDL